MARRAGEKVDGLIIKLFVATGAVVALIFIALGFIWQPALVVALVIPVVILITVFSAYLLGYTIDRVSLFALIFSIGILVDDAIVVVENIYRRWLINGKVDTKTTIDAVAEVGNPTISGDPHGDRCPAADGICLWHDGALYGAHSGTWFGRHAVLPVCRLYFYAVAGDAHSPQQWRNYKVMEAREHKQTILVRAGI